MRMHSGSMGGNQCWLGCVVAVTSATGVAATSPVSQSGTTTVMKSNPGSSAPFPGNPWVGTNRQLLIWLRGTPPVPDGPPPSAKELRAIEGRWAGHVREEYRAQYDSADGRVVEVQAIRFDDAT